MVLELLCVPGKVNIEIIEVGNMTIKMSFENISVKNLNHVHRNQYSISKYCKLEVNMGVLKTLYGILIS